MKLRYRYDYGSGREYSVAEAICKQQGRVLYDGELESLRQRLSSLEESTAWLIETLHSSGKLTDEQVLALCHSFERSE